MIRAMVQTVCSMNFVIEFREYLMPYLCTIFNAVLSTGYFPTAWSDAMLVPIFKSGEVNDAANYRGISLVSNLGKVFTSVLNVT